MTGARQHSNKKGRPKYYVSGATVKNLRIFATLLNGEQLELRDCPTGSDLIRAILHDAAVGAKVLVIEATDKDGRVVRIVVPADDSETARVAIALDA
jgi:hypothetical protein